MTMLYALIDIALLTLLGTLIGLLYRVNHNYPQPRHRA
jgi:energy-converting hydrogenase Eha subunit F